MSIAWIHVSITSLKYNIVSRKVQSYTLFDIGRGLWCARKKRENFRMRGSKLRSSWGRNRRRRKRPRNKGRTCLERKYWRHRTHLIAKIVKDRSKKNEVLTQECHLHNEIEAALYKMEIILNQSIPCPKKKAKTSLETTPSASTVIRPYKNLHANQMLYWSQTQALYLHRTIINRMIKMMLKSQ